MRRLDAGGQFVNSGYGPVEGRHAGFHSFRRRPHQPGANLPDLVPGFRRRALNRLAHHDLAAEDARASLTIDRLIAAGSV